MMPTLTSMGKKIFKVRKKVMCHSDLMDKKPEGMKMKYSKPNGLPLSPNVALCNKSNISNMRDAAHLANETESGGNFIHLFYSHS